MWLCWRTRALSTAPSGSRSASNAVRPCLTVRPGLSRGPQTLLPSGFRHPQSPGPTGSPIRYASMVQLRPLGGADSVQCALSRGGLVTPRLAPLVLVRFPCRGVSPPLGYWRPAATPFPMARPRVDALPPRKPSMCPMETQPPIPSVRPSHPPFPCGYLFLQSSQTLLLPCLPMARTSRPHGSQQPPLQTTPDLSPATPAFQP